jgi:ribosomal protein S18 acetylase RimI-like enzyme
MLTSPPPSGRLRPLDVRRDLEQVASLMESSFADTLDPDGQRYLRQMRAASRESHPFWSSLAPEGPGMPPRGYVWEESGRIVGNLTMIPFFAARRKIYLIANVAVHPDCRRRGIGRRLTQQALQHARDRKADAAWLQVRQENEAAIRLYQNLGFVERARRATWLGAPRLEGVVGADAATGEMARRAAVGERLGQDWPQQKSWLARAYPDELRWHINLSDAALRPGLIGGLYRTFNEVWVRQWALRREGRLLGALTWQNSPTYADNLWLAVPPEGEGQTATLLLKHARERLQVRPLALDYPAGRAEPAIHEAGFTLEHTLIWMSAGW